MPRRKGAEGEPAREDRIIKITVNFPLEQGEYLDSQAAERHTTVTEILREAVWIHKRYQERILGDPNVRIVERRPDGTERDIVFFTSPNQSTEKIVKG